MKIQVKATDQYTFEAEIDREVTRDPESDKTYLLGDYIVTVIINKITGPNEIYKGKGKCINAAVKSLINKLPLCEEL